ncbi:MAG: dTDP-4-dehydrorhamnose reductase [Sneathiella sp.]|nr:MAG: dTDP-4-dehydrorhamnose reductase [Sneathiella sp.]
MKILVTGAGGQVGGSLIDHGAQNNCEVVGLDRAALDISDLSAVQAVLNDQQPDIVINAAAYTAVDRAEAESERALAINATGPENLALVCKKLDIPLLHISTDFVFDGDKQGAYVETDSVAPLSVYGVSKAKGETNIAAVGGKHIILRTAWVFGGEQNFVTTMLRLGASRTELNIVDDQIGGPTSCEDIAQCLLTIATRVVDGDFSEWGIYHYCGAPSVSWFGFASAIFAGKEAPKLNPIPTKDYPTPAVRPKNSVLDCTKIKQIFNIDQPDWRSALSSFLG